MLSWPEQDCHSAPLLFVFCIETKCLADQGAEPMTARTEDFERHRSLLFSIAYRMLASVTDAEDIVQEAYLR
jgi:DNA-directed RNA polymerase specialized sigma24 family protein